MAERRPNDGPVGVLTRDALEALIEGTEPGEGVTKHEAIEIIAAADENSDEKLWADIDPEGRRNEAGVIVDDLLDNGYLYEVENTLHITDREILNGDDKSG